MNKNAVENGFINVRSEELILQPFSVATISY